MWSSTFIQSRSPPILRQTTFFCHVVVHVDSVLLASLPVVFLATTTISLSSFVSVSSLSHCLTVSLPPPPSLPLTPSLSPLVPLLELQAATSTTTSTTSRKIKPEDYCDKEIPFSLGSNRESFTTVE